MKEQTPLFVASKPTTVKLIAGAAGIVVQILSGVAKYPKSPEHRHPVSGGPPGFPAAMPVHTSR